MSVYSKLLELQKSARALKKDGKAYNYNYLTGDKLLSVIRPKKDEQEATTSTGWKGGPAQAQPNPMPPVQGVPPEAYFQEQPDDLPF